MRKRKLWWRESKRLVTTIETRFWRRKIDTIYPKRTLRALKIKRRRLSSRLTQALPACFLRHPTKTAKGPKCLKPWHRTLTRSTRTLTLKKEFSRSSKNYSSKGCHLFKRCLQWSSLWGAWTREQFIRRTLRALRETLIEKRASTKVKRTYSMTIWPSRSSLYRKSRIITKDKSTGSPCG